RAISSSAARRRARIPGVISRGAPWSTVSAARSGATSPTNSLNSLASSSVMAAERSGVIRRLDPEPGQIEVDLHGLLALVGLEDIGPGAVEAQVARGDVPVHLRAALAGAQHVGPRGFDGDAIEAGRGRGRGWG